MDCEEATQTDSHRVPKFKVIWISGARRLCHKCGVERPVEAFSRDRNAKDGIYSTCSLCKTQAARALKAQGKEAAELRKLNNLLRRGLRDKGLLECRSCGKFKELEAFPIKKVKGQRYRCYHCWAEWRDKNRFYVWTSMALAQAKSRARLKSCPFGITRQDILDVCVDRCPALGIELVYGNKGGICDNSATLDRIIPDLGYIRGNIQVLSMKANRIKNSATAEEVLRVGHYMQRRRLVLLPSEKRHA